MYINLNIEVIKIFKLNLLVTTNDKAPKDEEVIKNEETSDTDSAESK